MPSQSLGTKQGVSISRPGSVSSHHPLKSSYPENSHRAPWRVMAASGLRAESSMWLSAPYTKIGFFKLHALEQGRILSCLQCPQGVCSWTQSHHTSVAKPLIIFVLSSACLCLWVGFSESIDSLLCLSGVYIQQGGRLKIMAMIFLDKFMHFACTSWLCEIKL